MKYTKQERLEIGKEIYTHNISVYVAAEKYGIDPTTARGYMRMYRDINALPPVADNAGSAKPAPRRRIDYSDLEGLTKEQLVAEVIRARAEAERAKKGYTVQEGGGAGKEFISLSNQSSR